jgi:PAS domain S-box-containing protein
MEFIKSGAKTAAGIAPSFAADLGLEDPGQLVTALKKIGFAFVEETAEGAEWVAKEHLRLVKEATGPVITSCCPVIVNLLEIYYPHLLPYLAPVVSPMTAHGRMMKKRHGKETKVVFIGPCIAKKGERRREENKGIIDAVLTFAELNQVLSAEGIDPALLEPGRFDREEAKSAHAFAVPGGLARSAPLSTDLLAEDVITVDGLEECLSFLEKFAEVKKDFRLIELLACRGGCVMGPGMKTGLSAYARRNKVLDYANNRRRGRELTGEEEKIVPAMAEGAVPVDLYREYTARAVEDPEGGEQPSEEEIRRILARTGKLKPADELNCGACGYNSCRDKAIAVAKGMAEIDMCIPYMRAKAESRADLICRAAPNAILVVSSDLKVLELNPAAEKMLYCRNEEVKGKDLKSILDPKAFAEVLRTKKMVTGEAFYPAYGLAVWQAIFYVETEDVLIGILIDITNEKQQRERLDMVTRETLEKAREVIDKQMRVAQEIAGLLGETTAETKVLLTKLIKLIVNEEGEEK